MFLFDNNVVIFMASSRLPIMKILKIIILCLFKLSNRFCKKYKFETIPTVIILM